MPRLIAQPGPASTELRGAPTCTTCRVEWRDDVTLAVPPSLATGAVEGVAVDARRRALVFDGRDRFVRALHMPLEPHGPVIIRWPDRVLASGALHTPSGAGRPLHLLSFAGEAVVVQRSVASGDEILRPQGPPLAWHEVSRRAGGGVWAAWRYGYTLSRWSDDLRRLAEIGRRVPWFDERRDPGLGTHSTPPSTEIVHLSEDESGLLWVYFRRAAPQWRRAWRNVPRGHAEVPVRMIDLRELYEYHLEILDVASGGVVVSAGVAGEVIAGLPDGRVAVVGERSDGESSVTIRRASLRRR